jgi:hypothetical protein
MPKVIKIPDELAIELDLLAQAEHKRRGHVRCRLSLARCPAEQTAPYSQALWGRMESGPSPGVGARWRGYVETIRSESDERL